MALETKLSLRQTQKMIMTPMLQEAIGLLQLSHLELQQVLRLQMEENPILDEALDEEAVGEDGLDRTKDDGEEVPEKSEDRLSDFDWESYLENTSDYRREFPSEHVERADLESLLTRPRSLADHLLFQLHLSTSDQTLLALAALIIGTLDENGYLTEPLDALAASARVSLDSLETALRLVHGFDPIGVAARDLRECLLLQLAVFTDPVPQIARAIVADHLPALESHHFTKIAEALKVSVRDVQDAVQIILQLEPKPGRTFNTEEPRYITPDVYIVKVDDRLVVVLNEDGLPRLRVNGYYRSILSQKGGAREVREYIEGRMRSALWLIRSIEQRQRTLYKVTESITRFQKDFIENGIGALRPLTLREVAEDIEMHESTVSRVTTNKYVHSPQGLFELKYFFHRGVPATGGDVVSSLTVKDLVRQYLSGEDQGKPLSDQKIVQVLREKHGIEIARRTVAKYRGQLKIPSSSKRKRF